MLKYFHQILKYWNVLQCAYVGEVALQDDTNKKINFQLLLNILELTTFFCFCSAAE